MTGPRRSIGTVCALLAASLAAAPAARAAGDPLRIPAGVAKQSDLLRAFSTLKQFVRNIPRDVRACVYSLRPRSETIAMIEKDAALRARMREIFESRINAPTKENCLGFTNVPREFEKIMQTDLGVCAGVTYVAWLTNYLAIWDEAGKDFARYKVRPKLAEGWTPARIGDAIARWRKNPGKGYNPKDKDAIAEFFAPFVANLYDRRAVTVIPYFANLEEFSSHPAMKDLLKRVSLEKWAHTNFAFRSLIEMGFSGRHVVNDLRKLELERVAKEAEDFLESGIGPIVFFSLPSHAKSARRIHVVRVKKVVRSADGDRLALVVVDPNFKAPDNVKTIRVSGLKEAGDLDRVKALYSRYQDDQIDLGSGEITHPLAELEIVPWFEVESVDMLRAWKVFLEEFG